jgi:CRISPR/Cas system-associated protein Cas10 (large subunit of type III CRISPR-Cas system)
MFAEKGNPILEKFTGAVFSDADKKDRRLSKNSKVKDIAKKIVDVEKWSLIKEDGDIKDLSDIAESVKTSGFKKHNYYAIVRSDGDNMSKIIENLNVNTINNYAEPVLTLTDFSKICLEYCSEVAKLVKEFRGIPIYSSGDDLLAIMPCDSGEKGTVLNFIKEVNKKFNEMFKPFISMINDVNAELEDDNKIAVPSLSFGISICFKKFPLYEALDDSAKLLFGIAKEKKNCIAMRLQKHSGQSEGLLIYNDALDDVLNLQKTVLEKDVSSNDVLLSALYKTEQFSKLFLEAKTEAQIENLFINTFDASEHKNNSFVHKQLPEFYGKIRENKKILALSEDEPEKDKNDIKVFNFVLRILKFFVEKAGKEGKDNE